jgi:DNA-binding NtrC family response regulator
MKRAVLGPPIRDPSTEPYLSATSPTRELLALARQVANAVDTPVVIQGESGAGKKVLARFIHQKTPGRQQGPFVVFNCGAVSAEQLEGELFGTEVPNGEPGQQFGALAAATGGTLVLEELAMLPMAMQPRLLRVLDWGCYRAAGATQDQECDVRLIVSTCGDLEKDVRLGRLRLDLLHRLNVFQLEVLPLRERQGEVLALAELFLGEFALKRGRARQRLDERAQEQLLAHDFPGNVRELRNAIERAVIIESGPVIGLETLSLGTAGLSATGRGFDAATRANEVGAAHLAG